jgi:adenylate cyclase
VNPAEAALLVVDDDRVNRTLLSRALERSGHVVTTAEDGVEALRLLEGTVPDIVLLDVVMPELDGMSVLEQMKASATLRDVPVIMISALDDFDSVVRCIELGAEDYLPKPFDPVLLRARINAGLSKRRIHDLERARVRDVFARFLPETVVDEVLRDANGDPRLGGVRLVGTVLVSDLRGFTTFAERTPPDVVVDVLNAYFGEMSHAILDCGGTLLGFLGDGILAVFGAPIACDDHAERALAAATEMVSAGLPRFNEHVRATLGEDAAFRMGIGVASGPFMSGNVGSEQRLQYTVIGDTINTASRIEGLTKGTGHIIFLADSTKEALVHPPEDLVYVDEFDIRGRQSRVKLWSIADPSAEPQVAPAGRPVTPAGI